METRASALRLTCHAGCQPRRQVDLDPELPVLTDKISQSNERRSANWNGDRDQHMRRLRFDRPRQCGAIERRPYGDSGGDDDRLLVADSSSSGAATKRPLPRRSGLRGIEGRNRWKEPVAGRGGMRTIRPLLPVASWKSRRWRLLTATYCHSHYQRDGIAVACARTSLWGQSTVNGKVKAKVEPSPTLLVTQILPPCSSMNLREMASPSPVPSTFFDAVPTCRNSSNTVSWSSGAMPTPVSCTETSAAVVYSGPHLDPPALRREFQCVRQEVQKHLLHLALVGANHS